jgi:hypothetical protein
MNEEDKAQKLSDAIDALLEGREPELDDKELQELLGVARLRLRAGQAMADVGKTYQDLLRRVLQARMVSRQMKREEESDDDVSSEIDDMDDMPAPREYLDPLDPDYGKLVNFLDFWPRVGDTSTRPGAKGAAAATKLASPPAVIPLWRAAKEHKATRADALEPAVDRVVQDRKGALSVDDNELNELLQVANLRRYVGESLASAGTPYKRRLWTVLRLRLAANLRRQSAQPPHPTIAATGRSWKYGVAAAAALALTLFTLGPWAASGFAQNPVSQVFDFVGGHVGVEGVEEPPPTQAPTTVPAEEVSPQQAAELLGIAVKAPTYAPDGYVLASAAYYNQSPVSPEQGMYQLVYTLGGVEPKSVPLDDSLLLIYQEQATPSSIAQKSAYIEEAVIAGSLPATYVRGIWQTGPDGALEWVEGKAEVLVFDSNGVRTYIVWKNVQQEKDELLKIAESMLTA